VPFAVLFAVLVVVNAFGAVIFGLIAAGDATIDSFDELPIGAKLGLIVLQDVVFAFGAWIAVRLVLGRTPPEQFGLTRVREFVPAVMWSIGIFAGFWIVTLALVQILGEPDDQTLVNTIQAEDRVAVLVGYGVLICVAAPIVEEFFFRGFMFTIFWRRLGAVRAALLVGVVFGIGHIDQEAEPASLIALGAFGVGLCILYWRCGSIIPCMAVHALNNAITFGAITALDPAPFAGVVAASVGVVIACGSAVSTRRSAVAA
jgi:membrane protease YdiL (CAAX protease family)